MYYLPVTENYGKLKIVSEYMRYDVPRVFIAKSKALPKEVYIFSYWTDECDTHDEWYYIHVNEDEKRRVENGDVQLRDLYKYKTVYSVITPFDQAKPATLTKLDAQDVDEESLPPIGFGVECVDGVFGMVKKPVEKYKTGDAFHEVRLFKPRGIKPISWSAAQQILSAWGRICESILDKVDANTTFSPSYAEVGSYKMQFKASHNQELISKILSSNRILNDGHGNYIEGLKALDVDPRLIEEFIVSLAEHDLQFDVRSNSGWTIANFNYKELEDSAQYLKEFNQKSVSSENIPQADEISRVIKYVNAKADLKPYNSETENITDRQILYYESAARMLGFTDKIGMLTPAGWRLSLYRDNEIEQYKIIVERFETSLCGWAWMQYSGVKSIYDVNPDSSEEFLLQYAIGLSPDTAKRRAKTLRHWLTRFNQIKQ
jgi:hypothetical protein